MSNNYWQTAQTSDFNPRQNERKPRYWIYALIAAAVAVSVFVVIGIVLAVLIVAGMAPTPYNAQLAPAAPIQDPGPAPAAAMPQFPGSAMPGMGNLPGTPTDPGNPQLQDPYEQRQQATQGAAEQWGGSLGNQMPPQQQGGIQPPVFNEGDVLSDPVPPLEGQVSEW